MYREPKDISLPSDQTLQTALDLHAAWLRGKPEGVRLDARGANLSDANLSDANLSHANLVGAKFRIAGQELTATETNFTRVVGSRHDGYRVGEYLQIGCKEHTIEYWLENVRAIAEANGYTPAQVEEYASLVEHVNRMHKREDTK